MSRYNIALTLVKRFLLLKQWEKKVIIDKFVKQVGVIKILLYIRINLFKLVFVFYRGTHGYMAPEVLQKGTAYDSSADWFSLGCMLFKLLRG